MDQKVLSALVMGLIISTSPVILQIIPYNFTYPLLAQAAMVATGLLMLIGGLYEAGADRYKVVLNFYVVTGTVLFLIGPVSGFLISQDIWLTLSFLTAVFIGLPAAALLHLSRKD